MYLVVLFFFPGSGIWAAPRQLVKTATFFVPGSLHNGLNVAGAFTLPQCVGTDLFEGDGALELPALRPFVLPYGLDHL